MTEVQQQPKRCGYYNPTCITPPPPVSPPTPPQLKYARDICSTLNKPLPRECEESYAACYRFIGDNKPEFFKKKSDKSATAPANAKGSS